MPLLTALTVLVFLNSHCSLGMVFAVNPTAEKTFEAFKVRLYVLSCRYICL